MSKASLPFCLTSLFPTLSADIARERAAAPSMVRTQSALKVDVVASIAGLPKTGVERVASRSILIEAESRSS